MTSMNYQLIEALNGTLMVVLFFMLVFMVQHLKWMLHQVRTEYKAAQTTHAVTILLHVGKPEIALSIIIFFLCLRTSTLWLLRFMDNHHIDDHFRGLWVISEGGAALLIVATVGLVIGVSYWIKVISPYKNGTAFAIWIAMIGTALLVGVGGALLP